MRDFSIEGNDTSGYVGVDPEYRNYANETDKPYLTDDERTLMAEVGLQTDDEKLAAAQESDDEPQAVDVPVEAKSEGDDLDPQL